MSSINEQLNNVEKCKLLLVARATGGQANNEEYTSLRSTLMKSSIKNDLPSFLGFCRDLDEFWFFIKGKFDTYEGRRVFIREEFNKLLEYLENNPSENNQDVVVENKDKMTHPFLSEQLEKCDNKISNNDFDGAITNARSLLEGVLDEIYKTITGETLDTKGDLTQAYKQVKKLLNLGERGENDFLNDVTRGLTSAVNGIASMANKMGDRHNRTYTSSKRHARLAVNAVKTVTDFLYDVFEYHKQQKDKMYGELLELKYTRYGNEECYYGKCYTLKTREELLQNQEFSAFHNKCDVFMRKLLLDELIKNFNISSYDNCDQFIMAMIMFYDELTSENIDTIYEKHKNNNQAERILWFFKELHDTKSNLINSKKLADYFNNFNNFNK